MPKRSTTVKKQPQVNKPRGKNRDYDVVEVVQTACRKCASTDRSTYRKDPTRTLRQVFVDKVVVTEWRKCKCLRCGQWRFDKTRREEKTS